MLDVVLTNGFVIDGTGAPRRRADVGVRDGRVVALGAVDEPARETIDLDGQVVAPGFVDIHTHYDAQVFWDPALTPSPLHGVTTVVGGNCGFSLAPIEPDDVDYLTRMLARVEGMPLEALEAGVRFDWRTFGDYLDRLEGRLAVNAGFLVGHSAIRRFVMHADAVGGTPTPAQLDAMRAVLADSLAAGALGFSSSHGTAHTDHDGNPVPSRSASADEVLALATVVRDHPATTVEFIAAGASMHPDDHELLTALSLASQRPVNWNVLVPYAHQADAAWRALESGTHATERGARVIGLTVPIPMVRYFGFDPGVAFAPVPGWAKVMALPIGEKRAALSDPTERRRLADLYASPDNHLFRDRMGTIEEMSIAQSYAPQFVDRRGVPLGELAQRLGQDPIDVLFDVVVADDLRTVVTPRVVDDLATWHLRRDLWHDPRALVGGSDAGAHLDMLSTFNYTTGMLAGCRAHDLMELEEAVRLLTDVPARLYGLRGRGRIAPGWAADFVVFDPDTVGPGTVEPRADLPAGASRLTGEADGITAVIVNGIGIVADGRLTGRRPGTVLRAGRDTDAVSLPGAG